ncbi:MAG: acyl--CoA ligase [Silicimonas sp.]|nr:acyl--CoA ligase [Silicimonas sp.]
MNLAAHVLHAGGAPDDKTALVVLGATGADDWSYGRLRARVMATAGGLRALGLDPGARVLMRLGNSPDFPILYLGAIAAGLVPVPTSAALRTEEITRIAADLAPAAIVAHDGIALPPFAGDILTPDALADHAPLETIAMVAPDTPAYIVYTSGTSGTPLGVVHAHRAILARAMMIDGWYGLTGQDRMLHAGAFNWTFTLGTGLLDPWTMGATALVLAEGTPPDLIPDLARRHRATILAGAPGIFRRLLRGDLSNLPDLRHGLAAGEKLTEHLRDSWTSRTGTALHEAFGQSECSTFISGAPDHPAPEGTLGYAQPGRAVAILDGDTPVSRGEMGEIAVHASDPGLTLGYLSRPLARRGDWVPTGDIGLMRDDGAIEYHGRDDDMLTAGGFRVSPLDVETTMMRLDGIEEAAAIDTRVNADTTLIALHYTGRKLDEAALAAHAEAHLARYKQPRLFIHAQSLPRNANGKLLRKALRAAKAEAS